MHFVFGFGERLLRRLSHRIHFQHAHRGEKDFNERWRSIPQRRKRPNLSVAVGMKHSLVPPPRSLRVTGIFPYDVEKGLQHP